MYLTQDLLVGFVAAVMNTVRPNLATFLKYARVELTPPSPGDIPAISRGIGDLMSAAKNGRWKHLTVKVGLLAIKPLLFKLTKLLTYCRHN